DRSKAAHAAPLVQETKAVRIACSIPRLAPHGVLARQHATRRLSPALRSAADLLERQTVRNAPRYAETASDRVPAWGGAPPSSPRRGGAAPAAPTKLDKLRAAGIIAKTAGRGGACRPYETRLERRSVKPIGVLERPTVGNAPTYAEDSVERSPRVGGEVARFGHERGAVSGRGHAL